MKAKASRRGQTWEFKRPYQPSSLYLIVRVDAEHYELLDLESGSLSPYFHKGLEENKLGLWERIA